MTATSVIDIALPQHDIGIREVAALSARAAYVLMCFTLCWGIFTATGWIRRLTGLQAIRSGHMILATMTVATGATHAVVFLLLREQGLSLGGITVPFGGLFRHGLGILGLEIMIAITLATSLKNYVNYRRWLRFHQLAYPAIAMVVIHSWYGAIANGHLGVTWLAGITVLTPAITLTALRLTPPNLLIKAGLLSPAPKAAPPQVAEPSPNGAINGYRNGSRKITVSVDNQRCRRYGICQAESPDLFQLLADGRLRYVRDPENGKRAGAQAAARSCPMQAIQLQEVRNR
ncbi:ferredoxin [Actinophytocola sp.]|uniref:ferredoxin n=1 Tax=Actinophytocola sp. TaxID=1872138 RepID=UPI003D6BAA34